MVKGMWRVRLVQRLLLIEGNEKSKTKKQKSRNKSVVGIIYIYEEF